MTDRTKEIAAFIADSGVAELTPRAMRVAIQAAFPGLTDAEFTAAQCLAIGSLADATNAAEERIVAMLADPVNGLRIVDALRVASHEDLRRFARETGVAPENEAQLVAYLGELRERVVGPGAGSVPAV